MVGIFTYIYHKNQLNVGKYTLHGSYMGMVPRYQIKETRTVRVPLLGCPRKLGSKVRINGLFHLLINGVYWGYNPLIQPLILTSGVRW